MTLREQQSKFAHLTAYLILYIYQRGYEMTYGDAWAHPADMRHIRNSKHYDRLALDINLYRNGRWLKKTEEYSEVGEYWKSLDPECTWGGDFSDLDGCHFSYGEH